MTVTPNTPSFGGHFFPDFMGPVLFNDDAGGGDGGAPPVVDAGDSGAPPAGDAGGAAPDAAALAAAAAAAGVETPPVVDGGESNLPVDDGGSSDEGGDNPDDSGIPEHLKPYVQQLRQEAADRRVALKAYEDAFGQYDDGDRTALLGVVSALADPERQHEAAAILKELADEVLGDVDDPDRPLTRADLERIERDKQAKAQQEAAVNAVITEAKELGYEEGTREQRRLLDLAVNETKGDLKAAHEAIQAEREAVIADFVKQVQEGKAKWPTLAPPPGVAPADITGGPPKTFAEARKAAEARARARAASAM